MLLIVDDNTEIRESLNEYLEKNGLKCETAEDAQTARDKLATNDYQLVILDIMMPGEDGLSLCRYIHESSQTPVILLTAMDEDTDRIIGLEVGADDYLSKPFNPRELLARIKAILRRESIITENIQAEFTEQTNTTDNNGIHYLFGDWSLSVNQQQLRQGQQAPKDLSTGEFRLLMAFVERPKRVVSRDELLDLVSNRSIAAFDRSIDNQISRLRKKIEVDPKQPTYIKTVWGGGYTFGYEVTKKDR